MTNDPQDMTDDEWKTLQQALPTDGPGPRRRNDRKIFNGIFHILRTGEPWRNLPERYGPHSTCFNRYNRWRQKGGWAKVSGKLQVMAENGDGPDGDAAAKLLGRMTDSSTARLNSGGLETRQA